MTDPEPSRKNQGSFLSGRSIRDWAAEAYLPGPACSEVARQTVPVMMIAMIQNESLKFPSYSLIASLMLSTDSVMISYSVFSISDRTAFGTSKNRVGTES